MDDSQKHIVKRLRQREPLKETLRALATLVLLVIIARMVGVAQWPLAGLWAFMAIWAIRTAILVSRVVKRREIVAGGVLVAAGCACTALLYVLRSPTLSLAMAIAGASLFGGALVVAVVAMRRGAH